MIERLRQDDAGIGDEDVDPALVLSDLVEQAVEIGVVADVALDAFGIGPKRGDRAVEFGLSAPGDIDESAFVDEAAGRGEAKTAVTAVTSAIFPSSLLMEPPVQSRPRWPA